MEPNVQLITYAVISVVCAVYGIWRFSNDYTCLVVNWNKTAKKWCNWIVMIPSALLTCLVLMIAVYKGLIIA